MTQPYTMGNDWHFWLIKNEGGGGGGGGKTKYSFNDTKYPASGTHHRLRSIYLNELKEYGDTNLQDTDTGTVKYGRKHIYTTMTS